MLDSRYDKHFTTLKEYLNNLNLKTRLSWFKNPLLLAIIAFIFYSLLDPESFLSPILSGKVSFFVLLRSLGNFLLSLAINGLSAFFKLYDRDHFNELAFVYFLYSCLFTGILYTILFQEIMNIKFKLRFSLFYMFFTTIILVFYSTPVPDKYTFLFPLYIIISFIIAYCSLFVANRTVLLLKDSIELFNSNKRKMALSKSITVLVITSFTLFFALNIGDLISNVQLNMRSRNLIGFIDKTGKIVIPPEYFNANQYQEGFACVQFPNGKWGALDKTGKIIIKPVHNSPFISYRGLISGGSFHKQFVLDKQGKVVLTNIDWIYYFTDDLLIFMKNDKRGLMDRKFNIVVKPMFTDINLFIDGIAVVNTVKTDPRYPYKGNYGVIDTRGNFLIKPHFPFLINFKDGLIGVCIDNKWGLINKTGNFILKPQFDSIKFNPNADRGLIRVIKDKKYGYIDLSGKLIIKPVFKDAKDFYEGLAIALSGDKYGFIDKTGKFVIAPQFSLADFFTHGVAIVQLNNKLGLINKRGEFIVAPQYYGMTRSLKGIILFNINNKWGLMNESGKVIVKPEFDYIGDATLIEAHSYYPKTSDFKLLNLRSQNYYDSDQTYIIKNSKYGFIDKSGKIIASPQFDEISSVTFGLSDGMAGVKKDGKWGFIDLNGKMVIKPQFLYVSHFHEGLAMVYFPKKGWVW